MMITKYERKILNYIYRRGTVSFQKLSRKFRKYPNLQDTISDLVYHHFVVQIGGHLDKYGDLIPFAPETNFQCDNPGRVEVENHQWFDLQFVLLQIVLPIVIAIITTLITIFLSA